jgi:hypothetical protein
MLLRPPHPNARIILYSLDIMSRRIRFEVIMTSEQVATTTGSSMGALIW